MAVAFLQRQPGVIDPLLVEVDIPTIGPGGPNNLWHGIGEEAKLLLALAQHFLDAEPLRHIHDNGGDAEEVARRRSDRADIALRREDRAVLAAVVLFELKVRASRR